MVVNPIFMGSLFSFCRLFLFFFSAKTTTITAAITTTTTTTTTITKITARTV